MNSEKRGHPEVIGGCRIIRELGEGGMGVVFLAYSDELGRYVAVEILKPEAAACEGVAERYLRGGRAASKVDHPGIVRTFACGTQDGRPYTVMELVDGSDLMELLDTYGSLTVRATLEVAEAVAIALGAALEQVGLIHRDVKPDNIMVTRDGVVKVTDLDLAKIVGDQGVEAVGGLTAAGVAMGTPYYMSPEQCIDSSTVDHRADIFSLGATLYQLLSGECPFTGKTLYTLMRNVVESDPPPLPEKIPAPVRELITKMLAKNPDERHLTYDELVAAIRLARSRVEAEGTAIPSVPGRADSAPGQSRDRFATLPFHRVPEGGTEKAVVEEGRALMGELLAAARELIESDGSGDAELPADLESRLGCEAAVVQAAVEVVSPETGLHETAARFPEREIVIRETRRRRRQPPSLKQIHVRSGTALVEGKVLPVRILRQAVEDREGHVIGRTVLVLRER